MNKKLIPYFLLLPAFVFYILFWLTPVISGVRVVFTDLEGNFTLTENFIMMFESSLFREAVFNTALFAAASVIFQYFLALTLAVLLARKFLGSKLLLFVAMIPMAITPTAVAILWRTGLLRDGWVNSVLVTLGIIDAPILFLNTEGIMLVMLIVLIDTWTVTPAVMIILLAGLQGMQKELREAAYTFGANKWQIFKDIVLPILRPSITTSIVLRLIAAIQVWAIAVMVVGFSNAPFLVERVAFYVDVIPGLPTSEKLAFTLSFFTTVIVFIVTVIYLKISRSYARKGGRM